MTIPPIRSDELAIVAVLPDQDERDDAVRAYVERVVAGGARRPDWCFVAKQTGAVVGSVAITHLPGNDWPLSIVQLETPSDDPDSAFGDELLRYALEELTVLAAETVEHVFDDPPSAPQRQHHAEQRTALLLRHGFTLRDAIDRFVRRGHGPRVLPARLSYRDLDAVGDDAFLDAMVQVSEGTLDDALQADRTRYGPVGAAEILFHWLHELEHDRTWWQLAYAPTGDLVGLVMPVTDPVGGRIGYVGVIPAYRGRRYVDDLLAQASATLHAAGYDDVIVRSDPNNAPMVAALRRAGYVHFSTRRYFTPSI